MAAQCGVNSATTYVSSNAYYGYVPVVVPAAAKPDGDDDGMDVDFDDKIGNNNVNRPMEGFAFQQQQQQKQNFHVAVNGNVGRKRNFNQEEFSGVYMPRFKRFREGNTWSWSEASGLSPMYNEPLLRLSPAANSDLLLLTNSCQKQMPQPASHQEFEDMLLLTHGCSSYHHYRQNQFNMTNNEEAEF